MTTSVSSRQEEIESALPADLDALPRLDGFRLRGIQMTRLETFIDAAFAFAITMLVIIQVYINPLKAVFGAMWYYLCNGQVGQTLRVSFESQARTLFAAYGIGFSAIALEILLLNLRAWNLREPLRLNARERLMTFGQLTGWSIPVSIGLLSLVLALTLPIAQLELAGWAYFSMALVVPFHSIIRRRRLAADS